MHHVHLHPLGGSRVSVTAHVVVDGARSVHDAQEIVEELRQVLVAERSITHSTLQLECHPCGDGHDSGCDTLGHDRPDLSIEGDYLDAQRSFAALAADLSPTNGRHGPVLSEVDRSRRLVACGRHS